LLEVGELRGCGAVRGVTLRHVSEAIGCAAG
jgi:hypothetical protein